MKIIFFAFFLLAGNIAIGQENSVDKLNPELLNWYNMDYTLDSIVGVSVEKAYDSILNLRKQKKRVVVAVLDSGIDIYHEELKNNIWVNKDEIPGNQIDDDNNGYIDDIHGWNFLGNSKGENVFHENLEITRILKSGDTTDSQYARALNQYTQELQKQLSRKTNLEIFENSLNNAIDIIYDNTGILVSKKEDLESVVSYNETVINAKKYLSDRFNNGFTNKILENAKKRNSDYLNYFLNKDFNPRIIIGDNPDDFDDKNYGNNDVIGPFANHGTSVAGIIAGNRYNDLGIKGIANNADIMVLRVVPNGDERDKDIALAIIYAVDNGADIVNMSFGKGYSPNKEFVDFAVTYANEHGVLLVHGSGNDGNNLGKVAGYPNDQLKDNSQVTNWINIGATGKIPDKNMPAVFSNYGKSEVDLFAPGVDIISLDTNNTYRVISGTSFSAPVVSGIAAMILSYYPELTPDRVISVLLESSHKFKHPKKVLLPNLESKKHKKVKFSKLSVSGGIVNAYEALKLIEEKYTP